MAWQIAEPQTQNSSLTPLLVLIFYLALNLNLTGAAILSDNLTLNITGNINKKDLQDSFYSESMGFGLSSGINIGGNQATVPGSGGKPNTAPGGSTSISGNYSENEASRSVYATIGSLSDYNSGALKLTSSTNSMIGADFEGSLTLDHRLFSEGGRNDITKNFKELGQNLNKNPLTPMGASVAIENYTGHELTWKRGGEATFKEKGHEFETLDPRANNIGLANVIATDPNDPDYDPSRLHLIGKPLSADPSYVLEPSSTKEGSPFSNASNTVPGLNSILAIPHDKFGQNPLINKAPILQLTIPPFIPIGYYGLIGKSIRNTYEQPKVNNSTVGKP